jgi:hypothetical protein
MPVVYIITYAEPSEGQKPVRRYSIRTTANRWVEVCVHLRPDTLPPFIAAMLDAGEPVVLTRGTSSYAETSDGPVYLSPAIEDLAYIWHSTELSWRLARVKNALVWVGVSNGRPAVIASAGKPKKARARE